MHSNKPTTGFLYNSQLGKRRVNTIKVSFRHSRAPGRFGVQHYLHNLDIMAPILLLLKSITEVQLTSVWVLRSMVNMTPEDVNMSYIS